MRTRTGNKLEHHRRAPVLVLLLHRLHRARRQLLELLRSTVSAVARAGLEELSGTFFIHIHMSDTHRDALQKYSVSPFTCTVSNRKHLLSKQLYK